MMKKIETDAEEWVKLDQLIAEITVHAQGDDEQFQAFRQMLAARISLPSDGFVIGEPVSVVGFEYDGNQRRGLTVRCRRHDGSEHVVVASEVILPASTGGARYLDAYRMWMGLDPSPRDVATPPFRKRQHKVKAADIDLGGPVELVVLSVAQNAARCRLLGSDRVITLRPSRRLWDLVPGEIAVVSPRRQWSYAGHPYLSGEIDSTRLDAAALGLVPLKLEDQGAWTPGEDYWGEEDEPIEDWAKPIIAHGPRRAFEMEQVVPGRDEHDFDSDPICESNDLKDAGDHVAAHKILMGLCWADLRCLDAHAHLGNLVFGHGLGEAIRHYEVGFRIGELSLGPNFDDLLPWGHIDNRPFLRCMHGFGLCLWRLGRFEEAARIFDRMLWLNPSDNQGVRFLIDDVGRKRAWEGREGR